MTAVPASLAQLFEFNPPRAFFNKEAHRGLPHEDGDDDEESLWLQEL
jgi:hypothetical protein